MPRIPTFVLALLLSASASAQPPLPAGVWSPDRGDGTYANPVLAGDYSDPDVVRVGDDYYLTASSFTNVPGLPVLHSRDLVNWTLVGHALPRLPQEAHHAVPRRGGGVWAPSIRHRDGLFRIYWGDPDFGIYTVSARDPAGPWSAPVRVDDAVGAIDPAPFWDDDGQGWLVHAYAKSRSGRINEIVLKRLNADGTRTVGEEQVIVDGDALPPVDTSDGRKRWVVIEGPKLYKRGGEYLLFAPAGGVKGGWQGVFRARDIRGPYAARNVLDQGATPVNGPHQGAWVDTPQGGDWFVHFSDADAYGRRVHLQPLRWGADGWPLIGERQPGTDRGQPVLRHAKPRTADASREVPTVDDAFDRGFHLGWQWQANPAADWVDRSVDGVLRLKSASSPRNLWESGQLLAQKLPGTSFAATVRLVFAPVARGERAGLALFGADYGWIGIDNGDDGPRLVQVARRGASEDRPEAVHAGPMVAAAPVWLRVEVEPVTVAVDPPADPTRYWPAMTRATHARARFSYSLDGREFVRLGDPVTVLPGRWVGAQLGLFAQSPSGTPAYTATRVGFADFDDFEVR
ncbi:glycoside hydrolase family 43 protein [Coralloluteibacterium stylophorae]|uniref:Glycoside hydrolase 43 family protein n=1 Tax=Coralloluteibacterium stylophorae TaxID=1776034 RepID=A0A8J8AYT8_9GAMM|nr:glycoside hydrolase 43 family protein [Coralloluteibacterium stylophorae]MBS7458507.1 glycoside hydrolase 43 family protein [Coralloluteibacterium stylophorae]